MRPKPDGSVVAKLRDLLDECAIAAPVLHELEFGVERLPKSRRKQMLTRYLTDVVGLLTVLPYDADAARVHARERARLDRRGATAPFVDGQIAAIARVHGLTLVTRNERDFACFDGLRVETW